MLIKQAGNILLFYTDSGLVMSDSCASVKDAAKRKAMFEKVNEDD